jgi:hypothetical protein
LPPLQQQQQQQIQLEKKQSPTKIDINPNVVRPGAEITINNANAQAARKK